MAALEQDDALHGAADGLSVAYLCGLLNSELLDLWYAVRGKTPWHVRRNYEPKPMARIPYRHVHRSARPAPAARAVSDAPSPTARLAALDALLAGPAAATDHAHALEAVVRALADNRRALLPHRAFAPALTATVKDPWRAEPPSLEVTAVLESLPAAETVSVRLDAELTPHWHTEGPLGRATLDGGLLRFTRARRATAEIAGPPARLALLERLVSARTRLDAAALSNTLLPKDLAGFHALATRRADEIRELLDDGRELVERAERLVCRLYGLPGELEDDVVAHAVERVRRASADADAGG